MVLRNTFPGIETTWRIT